jgi:hypothetical protein
MPKPGVSFSSFVYSLYVSALFHLGEGPEESEPDRQLARQTIDLLGILEQKTKGNLDEEEARHLHALLHDLRLRFLALGTEVPAEEPPAEGASEE